MFPSLLPCQCGHFGPSSEPMRSHLTAHYRGIYVIEGVFQCHHSIPYVEGQVLGMSRTVSTTRRTRRDLDNKMASLLRLRHPGGTLFNESFITSTEQRRVFSFITLSMIRYSAVPFVKCRECCSSSGATMAE